MRLYVDGALKSDPAKEDDIRRYIPMFNGDTISAFDLIGDEITYIKSMVLPQQTMYLVECRAEGDEYIFSPPYNSGRAHFMTQAYIAFIRREFWRFKGNRFNPDLVDYTPVYMKESPLVGERTIRPRSKKKTYLKLVVGTFLVLIVAVLLWKNYIA